MRTLLQLRAVGLSVLCAIPMLWNSIALEARAEVSQQAAAHVQADDPIDALQLQAVDLVQQGKLAEARKLVLAQISPNIGDANISFKLNYLLAFIDHQSESYKAAAKELQAALRAEERMHSPDLRTRVQLTKRIGDAYYDARDLKPALEQYQAALAESKPLSDRDSLKAAILEALVGTLTRQGNFGDAEGYAKQLVTITAARATSGVLADVGAWFWAQLELAGIYKNTGNEAARLALSKSVQELLRRALTFRAQLEANGTLPSFDDMKNEFLTEYMRTNQPSCLADYLWLADNWKMYSLPLIRWEPKSGVTPLAAILCIHGLGLENRAFTAFAHEMTERGYIVYAMDVRGFGAWQAIQGQEDVSFVNALADIGVVLNFIKESHDQLPTFLLGESMGGAIALRAGMKYSKNIAGIVSSVPSAEQYQERKMSLSVAMNFLRAKDRPIDIGLSVAQKATSNEELRKMWETDPKAKLNLSPSELLRFSLFMKKTTEECKTITATPVFLIQGLKDKLVKPEGTFQMFDNVTCDDKTMTIIGNAEHLIFESDVQNKLVVENVCTWLQAHQSVPASSAAAAPAGPSTGHTP